MKKPQRTVSGRFIFASCVVLLLVSAFLFSQLRNPPKPSAVAAAVSPFSYLFKVDGVLQETGTMGESTSPYWWVNSGGKLVLEGGLGRTVSGDLPLTDKWRIAYALANAADTDGGRHPQNLFRLLSRSTWDSARIQAQFKITKDNVSESGNRNESNGLLLMSRYGNDGDTLYYAGVRVDGTAVIKKKYRGTYYTMAQKKIFAGTYSRSGNPNLLPHNEWISLRSETVTGANGFVSVRLFMQRAGETSWTRLLEATDDGKKYGNTPPITGERYVGLRTDFMDVQFDSFRAEAISS